MTTGGKVGKSQRDKGRRGAREALALLQDRDWGTVETREGRDEDDAVVMEPTTGNPYSLEIKNQKSINLPAFLKQARENAAKRKMPWMLMCRLDGGYGWLVLRKDRDAQVWRGKEER